MLTVVDADITAKEFGARMLSDPLAMMGELRAAGPVVQVSTGERRHFFVAFHPAVIGAALACGVRTHRALLRELVGEGLFVVASGEKWRVRRDLLRPLFSARAVVTLHQVVLDAIEDYLSQRFPRGESSVTVDLGRWTQELSIQIILRLVDPELAGDQLTGLVHALREVVDYLDRRLFEPHLVSDAEQRQFAEHKELLERFVQERSVALRAGNGPTDTPGLLATLVSRTDRRTAGNHHSDPDEAVREEVLSLFVAGVETMGALLTSTLWYLDANPRARNACTDEAVSCNLDVLRAQPSWPRDALPYLRLTVLETLRLSPPAWALRRVFTEPIEVEELRFAPDDTVMACSYVTHRDPSLWQEPEAFRPERFSKTMPSPNVYFPFATGPHQCIGREFTLLEAQLTIAILLRRYAIEILEPGREYQLRPGIALTLRPNPQVALYARKTAAR